MYYPAPTQNVIAAINYMIIGVSEVISAIALVVALWALMLQRNEIIKNGRISALSHTSNLLQQKIDFHSKIIDALKSQGKDFNGHSHRVNNELRPLKEKVDFELLDLMGRHEGVIKPEEIKVAIGARKSNK